MASMVDLDGGDTWEVIEALYTGNISRLNDGEDCNGLDASRGACVYGEITTPMRLFKVLQLCSDDVFLDLGSGRGQAVLAAAMTQNAPKLAAGVEMVRVRHDVAAAALRNATHIDKSTVSLICGDALGAAMLSEATKVFICNIAFEGMLNEAFASALAPSRAPMLKRVCTMAPLTDECLNKGELQLAEVSAVGCSWSPCGTALYCYDRRHAGREEPAPPVTVDSGLLESVASNRRQAAAADRAMGHATEAEMERGLMRTAMMMAAARG